MGSWRGRCGSRVIWQAAEGVRKTNTRCNRLLTRREPQGSSIHAFRRLSGGSQKVKRSRDGVIPSMYRRPMHHRRAHRGFLQESGARTHARTRPPAARVPTALFRVSSRLKHFGSFRKIDGKKIPKKQKISKPRAGPVRSRA